VFLCGIASLCNPPRPPLPKPPNPSPSPPTPKPVVVVVVVVVVSPTNLDALASDPISGILGFGNGLASSLN
jgi:hypothetical protein